MPQGCKNASRPHAGCQRLPDRQNSRELATARAAHLSRSAGFKILVVTIEALAHKAHMTTISGRWHLGAQLMRVCCFLRQFELNNCRPSILTTPTSCWCFGHSLLAGAVQATCTEDCAPMLDGSRTMGGKCPQATKCMHACCAICDPVAGS